MRTHPLGALIGAVLLASAVLPARASDTFTFATDQAQYFAAPGQTINVKLYLLDTTSTGAFLLDSESGLASAGIAGLQIPNASPTPAPLTPAVFSQFTPDPAFNDPILTPLTTVAPATFSSIAFADITGLQGALPLPVDPATERVPLGDLLITAGTNTGDVTTFQLTDFSLGSDTLSFAHNFVLDPSTPTTFTVTVAAPEPATFALLTASGSILLRRRKYQPAR